ncbi:MAG: RagB/SusD family nutrient uptake outer membrane protein [Cyclobacteriaceae bacterium]
MKTINSYKNIIGFWSIILLILSMSACEDYLGPQMDAKGRYEEEFVWSNPSFARGPLYYAYQGLPTTFRTVDGDFTDVATDNAVSNNLSSDMRNFGLGLLSASNNTMNRWDNYYRYIRSINIFMENGLDQDAVIYFRDSVENAMAFDQYRGEAYFLRAWYHWSLLKLYGARVGAEVLGVPVVHRVLDVDDANMLERSTYKETVRAILADCDSALVYLQDEYEGLDRVVGEEHFGAPTTHACRGLKAMAVTFAASPAYTDGSISWDSAIYHLSEALIGVDGALDDTALPERDFSDPSDPDAIWRSYFATNNIVNEGLNFPPSYRGEGRTNPSHDLVQCFPAFDGRPFDENHPNYDQIVNNYSPYNSVVRDPRLFKYIFYNRSPLSGNAALGLQDGYVNTQIGGEDSRDKNPVLGTKTGYYLKKFSSSTAELFPSRRNGATVYYTAISRINLYLLLAEALNEVGYVNTIHPTYGVSAKDILRKVRGQYYTNDPHCEEQAMAGQEAFAALIKNERRIELCFEDTRFWDLRRWAMDVNTEVHGIKITHTGELLPSGDPEAEYEAFLVEQKSFAASSLPLPFNEVNLLSKLVQNPGWE